MIKLKDLINENSESTYSYGCVMLNFTFPEMEHIHSLIRPEDVYTMDGDNSFGLEDESHTTLLYGLHDTVQLSDVKSVIDGFTYYMVKLKNPSLFENDEYDVLKFDVIGDNLEETNEALKEFPHTSTFPNYHPHLTIGYLKKGTGKRYVNILSSTDQDVYWLMPTHVMFSSSGNKTEKINISIE